MVINKSNTVTLTPKEKLKKKFGMELNSAIDSMNDVDVERLLAITADPTINVKIDRTTIPYGVSLGTAYGAVILDSTLKEIKKVYVNGTAFNAKDKGYEGLNELINGDAISQLDGLSTFGKNSVKRTNSRRNRTGVTRTSTGQESEESYLKYQQEALYDLKAAGITYESFTKEFVDVFVGPDYDVPVLIKELLDNEVPEEFIPEFLVFGSEFRRELVGNLYGRNFGIDKRNYKFQTVTPDNETFLGKLLTKLDIPEAEYDKRYGTLKVGDRLITNLPNVDKDGIFHGINGTKYIPYHIGYFAEGGGSRIDRLRHIDPVQRAIDACVMQFTMTQSDVKFKTILDVSRNLPNFEKHPMGKELLETYKNKLVIEKGYLTSNSFLQASEGKTDELGAVKTLMLDDDAKGLIDPYGTSNGANLGAIVYLTEGSTFNPDGTLTASGSEHSPLGHLMNNYNVKKDNYNRHQMSFNALLTSIGVVKLNVAYAEFGMYNAEDACVLADTGAHKMRSDHDVVVEVDGKEKTEVVVKDMQVGDKIIDMHGDKHVSSIVVDRTMSPDKAKEEQLEHVLEFFKLNPDVDLVVSPVSLNSRLNLGVTHEGLSGKKQDLHLPDGSVIKNGIVEMNYIVLPQTAEHKSKDYSNGMGSGRKFSTLYRHAMSSKVGEDLYNKAMLNIHELEYNKERINLTAERLGVQFKDPNKMFEKDNIKTITDDSGEVYPVVDANKTIEIDVFRYRTPESVRMRLATELREYGTVNIDLGDMKIDSPLTGKTIKDSQGRNVLPVRVIPDSNGNSVQPFRYKEMYKNIALEQENELQASYARVCAPDYNNFVAKENLIKNIKTVTHHNGAKTEMMAPDPRLKLNQIRTGDDLGYYLVHRDPAQRSGNTLSFENVGGGPDNLTMINPLVVTMMNGDFDSDTLGLLKYMYLNLTPEEREEYFAKTNPIEELNHYGDVNVGIHGSHFRAMVLNCGINIDDITFKHGDSNEVIAEKIDNVMTQILASPKAYGAYAIDFTDENTVKNSLCKIADDGIKGKRADIIKHFEEGYTEAENKNVMEALIAKAEMTGMPGKLTNDLIARIGDTQFDPQLTRVAMEVTHSMTESVLKLKKNADSLPYIRETIKEVRKVFEGEYPNDIARERLRDVTYGLLKPEIVDDFCDKVIAKQRPNEQYFGRGVINNIEVGNAQLGFAHETEFVNTVRAMVADENTDTKTAKQAKSKAKSLSDIMADLRSQDWYNDMDDELEMDM